MNNNEIIAAYEEIDEINGVFHESLKTFEHQMEQELAELRDLLDDIKANWTGSTRDSFITNYTRKEDKLRECLERLGALKQNIAIAKQKIAQALEILRESGR